jgi:mannose-6-phosphate isomerase
MAMRDAARAADTAAMDVHRPTPFTLSPDYRPRVWGGQRLRAATPPIGELWAVWDENRIVDGAWAGRTLGEVVREHGAALLGGDGAACHGRFPLLIKLLDTADWLSVQVHPDDEQARRLEGPEGCGKAEAWHIVAANDEAALISGVRPGTEPEALADAIRGGTLLDLVERRQPRAGETYLLEPGTVHALGPGLLLYEVQQPSDITYRVFDWNRPAAEGRALHIEQSAAVARADRAAVPLTPMALGDGNRAPLLRTPWFNLDLVVSGRQPLAIAPSGGVQVLTAIAGAAVLRGDGWQYHLPAFGSVVVPAACGAYRLGGQDEPCRVLLATPGGVRGVR